MALSSAPSIAAIAAEGDQDLGVFALQNYGTADLGLVAYESRAMEGMIVDESVALEIVRPGTGEPVTDGEVGEVVVTTFNPRLSDDPLCHWRSFGRAAGTEPMRADEHAHQGLARVAPTRPPRSRACSCIRSRSQRW